MTMRDPLEQVVTILRDGPVPLRSHVDTLAQRERLLPELRYLVATTPKRLQRRRWFKRGLATASGCLAVGAVALTGYLQREPVAPAPVVYIETTSEERSSLATGKESPEGRHFRTLPATGILRSSEQEGVHLLTRRGIDVAMAKKSEVELSALESHEGYSQLTLLRGAVNCRVPKLTSGQHFSVKTPSLEVIVHGTAFSVEVGSGAQTDCVSVTEGVVEVRSRNTTELLGRGQSFGCSKPSEPEPSKAVENAPTPSVKPSALKRSTSSENDRYSLDDETQLLRRALVAERRGQTAQARQFFSLFLRKYPSSPLVHEASAGFARTQKVRP
jgi:hypothetical protein